LNREFDFKKIEDMIEWDYGLLEIRNGYENDIGRSKWI
jgi:hypothetical protein